MNRRRLILTGVGLALSAFFVFVMVRGLKFEELLASIEMVALPILALSLVTRAFGFLFMALRTKALLETEATLEPILRAHLAGFAGNNLLPFRLGELLRIDWLSRSTGFSRSHLLATAGIERLLDLLVLFAFFATMTPLALGVLPGGSTVIAFAVVLLLTPAATLAVAKYPEFFLRVVALALKPLGPKASGFLLERSGAFIEGLSALASLRRVAAATGFSIAYWTMTIISIRIWIEAFALDLPWYAPFFVTGFLAFGTALPSAPGFVGTWHYLCRSALVTLGVAETTAVAFAFVGHFMAVVPFTVVSVLWLGTSSLSTGLRLLGDGGSGGDGGDAEGGDAPDAESVEDPS